MDIIIETDLGGDPDDFFAICYLAAAGANIRAINLVPGHPYQIALASTLVQQACLSDCMIGISKDSVFDHTDYTGFNKKIINTFGPKPISPKRGVDVIFDTIDKYPKAQFFVIGPPTATGTFLSQYPEIPVDKLVMQGGFLPYANDRVMKVDRFIGQTHVSTFNMNGDPKNTFNILNGNIGSRWFVGKNLCHTIVYDREWHNMLKPNKHPASFLFKTASEIYLEKHKDKKFHDPTAAVALLHGDYFDWEHGTLERVDGKWGVVRDSSATDSFAEDVEREMLVDAISNFV